MLWLDSEEANSIPIKSVARLVIPRFQESNNKSTGECCKHTDQILGNLRLKNEDEHSGDSNNYAHCFTCGETWYPVKLVMDYKGFGFQDAMEFLYQNFPSYFTNVKEFDDIPKWEGLDNNEYKYLGIRIQHRFGDITIDVREFAREFPKEHDILLLSKIIEIKSKIDKIETYGLEKHIEKDKIQKDKEKIDKKLLDLLKRGLISTEYKKLKFEEVPSDKTLLTNRKH
ncbi:hypothetical protein [Alkaliphilus sp. B6464]|uniref:hypothetical protein n=1 Tax=Alkaliphilus sp. B6464 TaxID=2731219 RepID=UPI001BA6FE41|nr:hypothetical protein [Alkaliphilus sp. B6464]QUH22059.1 hypothetical protein HYG84_19325 [Alkaliphilus sp. B6464]